MVHKQYMSYPMFWEISPRKSFEYFEVQSINIRTKASGHNRQPRSTQHPESLPPLRKGEIRANNTDAIRAVAKHSASVSYTSFFHQKLPQTDVFQPNFYQQSPLSDIPQWLFLLYHTLLKPLDEISGLSNFPTV